jgi:malate dehydrogenase
VAGKPLTDYLSNEEIEGLLDRTRQGGAEIVGLLKTGSAYYAPSSAAARMVAAIITDEKATMPVCAWVSGEYGINDVYLGVPAKLGKNGVEEVVELELTDGELAALGEAAASVKEKVDELHQLEL